MTKCKIENLEDRIVQAVNFEAIPDLSGIEFGFSNENEIAFVGQDSSHQSFIGGIPLSNTGEIINSFNVRPVEADAVILESIAAGMDATATHFGGSTRAGGAVDGSPAFFSFDGALVLKRNEFLGRVVQIDDSILPIAHIRLASGASILNVDGLDYPVPVGFSVDSFLPPTSELDVIVLGGRNEMGRAAIIKFELTSKQYLQPIDFGDMLGDNSQIVGLTRRYDGTKKFGEPVALISSDHIDQVSVGSLRIDSLPLAADWFGRLDRESKVVTSNGISAYQVDGAWGIFIEANITAATLGIPPRTWISLDDIIQDQGLAGWSVANVSDIRSDAAGKVYIALTASSVESPLPLGIIASVIDDKPLYNRLNPNDVNQDGRVSPLDALLIINVLNQRNNRDSGINFTRSYNYKAGDAPIYAVDRNGDNRISPIDALLVINHLSASRRGSGEGEMSDTIEWSKQVDGIMIDLEFAEERKRHGAKRF